MRALIFIGLLVLAGCGNPTQTEQINATQAVVDQKVRDGRMTPAEARLTMADLKASISAERRRNYAIATSGGDGVSVYQPVGGGTYIRY